MRTLYRNALLLTLSTAAISAALAGVPAQSVHAAGTALDWKPCAQPDGPAGQECAELSVPLDYREPDGKQVKLAVSRVRSDRPEARRGTLIVIPGGPGSPAVPRLTAKGKKLQGELKGAYDLVALDPRGLGGSDKAGCGLADEDREMVNLRPWPGRNGDISENVARGRRIADACARDGGPLVRSMSTANEVRDIERFRQALGEEKLSAFATSYGTYVAAQFAQKFPERTDRFVLDSNGDPDPSRVARGWAANMSRAMEDRFPDFARWAADPARGELRLARRAEDVRPMFLALADRLDRHPRPTTTPGKPLTGNRLRQALQQTLSGNDFTPLATLIKAKKPALPPHLAQPLPDEEVAVTIGTICNDVRWPGSVRAYARDVAADRARYPLTAGMPVGPFPCAFWKNAPADEPARVTADGPSNILMIQNLRDPSTPYFGALKMREALGQRARLVTVDRGGHGVYLGNGNACGDAAVTGYLVTGKRPAADAYCAG
ncbi:alpha/beta fold hydrolase [Streptomyces sp. AV19]|uniref:alpha/beta hydrolase n=1 Tax=Streptomyces sp. AV19 TaxID=2793068 RepID=UPI0018FF0F58|nr:alpha/beta hydrolase [Streptomyces sp. AV19]MBH1935905.1 alpha/beta fold hydrolase [Streptomyces sp. AV19]MDG4534312.1 alpha/beta hydrolase [Streptomyces sp. AV19]